MVFPRIIVGMIIFQLTMSGLFFLKKYIVLGALCVPLIAITIVYKVVMDKAYYRSTESLPLQLLKEDMMKLPTHLDLQTMPNATKESSRPASVRSKASSLKSIRHASITSVSSATEQDLADEQRVTHQNLTTAKGTDEHETSELTTGSDNHLSENPPARNHSRLRRRVELDFDDYEAVPDKLTDYRQPPQTLNNGILDTGLRRYGNPVLVGVLPQLWLPVKANDSENAAQPRPKYRPQRSTGHIPATLSNMVKRVESTRKAVTGRARTIRRPRRKAAVYATSDICGGNSASSGERPLVPSAEGLANTTLDIPEDQLSSVVPKNNVNPTITVGDYTTKENENADAASYTARKNHPIKEEDERDSDSEPEASDVHKTYYHHPERRLSSNSIPSTTQQ
jgi:hypothetical protein